MPTAPAAQGALRPRVLAFPADFGAHPDTRTEWWYVTGTLLSQGELRGFQITFFRSRTAVPTTHPSRFAARQLLFAHAALSDLPQRRLRHDQRIARAGFGIAEASQRDTDVSLQGWSLRREGGSGPSRYRAVASSDTARFAVDLRLAATQPLLLQGEAGWSRKGPRPEQASHYYSEAQLAVSGTLRVDGRAWPVEGGAWLDHEWSDTLMDPQAVGWDWIGMNLDDGAAFMAFRLRRADGTALWAGGTFRGADGQTRSFASDAVAFAPGRVWTSPASRAAYPVEWTVTTPAGRFVVKALLDSQELDSRASTGSIYWEGLSELFDEAGRRVGRGYLEMTGYAAALKL
ncbi:carotenoid 1,2-hydratase [Piscinibacter sp. XHJ-5]|uniref:lipocalin-like domain-containing protein n=1 Tax=Piscinibacter sp. XHJ-5 TaxID=3037797 RepID=UPI0024531077|nr:carotenoid 1,2-hydratase [Piscinibacter sp. XHJ-5]